MIMMMMRCDPSCSPGDLLSYRSPVEFLEVVGARRNGGGLEWILKTEQHSFYLNINANVVSFRAFLSAAII